jgi:hypothetical protein
LDLPAQTIILRTDATAMACATARVLRLGGFPNAPKARRTDMTCASVIRQLPVELTALKMSVA